MPFIYNMWPRQSLCRRTNRFASGLIRFRYLHVNGDTYGRPIHGQKEISASSYANSQNLWKVDSGVYIRPSAEPLSSVREELFSGGREHIIDEL